MQWDEIQLQRWNDGEDLWWMNGTFNGGTAESKGIEVYLKAAVTDNLEFTASVNAGKAEYTEDIRSADGEVDTPAGTTMPFAPDLKYWVGLDYTIPRTVFGGDLTLRLNHSYSAETLDGRSWLDDDGVTINNADTLPSWGTTNAMIAWYGETTMVNLGVRNLFDKKYLQAYGDGWADDVDAWWPGETRFRETAVYNRPLEVTLQFRKNF
jgi:outer membrane receptor protein involved in Fe transport